MTGKQYEAILEAIADKLIEKDREISMLNFNVERLSKSLNEAERKANEKVFLKRED